MFLHNVVIQKIWLHPRLMFQFQSEEDKAQGLILVSTSETNQLNQSTPQPTNPCKVL